MAITHTRVTKEKRRAKTRGGEKRVIFRSPDGAPSTPEIDEIVLQVIGRIADKWTMCVLEVLAQNGVLRFTRIGELVGGISQRMLTKTLRQLEDDGFLIRTVYPEVPPRVEYQLTEIGASLCEAFCSVWLWAEAHRDQLRSGAALRRQQSMPGK
ncbi:ArsR family transcriptional regulator [Trinickia caryophylli]|uniref:Transcriptional regulator, HxlR family n=2 Tax=Trinickia caryophylli TaxID=28094 RepID=A0A1X7GL36_TRICW|nr:transcriptional regulator [Trinickia caryophylli]TRX14990.1 helix-turn-helix transcriptional regulator [Trinickia caryophylli]GLU35052.1 ArsR family transcriptional regulator [Trinickia caryophylli]SMF71270.1 transcriptional regulator, HxlR family [Trinickia caryophylli]